MKNIKQIIKEELNKDKFISLRTFENRLCDKQKKESLFLYNKILNTSDLNWFLLKNNKYENIDVSYDSVENYIIWNNGIWNSGHWQDGIWNYGEWIKGYWESGYWLGGEWHRGKIWNENLQNWVETTLNPAEYYKENNIKQ